MAIRQLVVPAVGPTAPRQNATRVAAAPAEGISPSATRPRKPSPFPGGGPTDRPLSLVRGSAEIEPWHAARAGRGKVRRLAVWLPDRRWGSAKATGHVGYE